MKIKCTSPQGDQKESQVPPSASQALIDQMIRQLESAGYTDIKLEGQRPEVSGRFISLDEQRAAMSAIEEEQHHSPYCPDCGGLMEQDGGYPYCERCEG